MIEINIRSNLKDITKKLDQLAYRQLPMATAWALTSIAKKVQAGEQANMANVLDRPTPFTMKAVGVKAARKDNLEAVVFVKDIQAAYLAPAEFGQKQLLHASKMLTPIGIDLNEYGNLPRSKIKQLAARSDVFIGTVKTKAGGEISGVWQRVAKRATVTSAKTGRIRNTTRGLNATGHLKLLVRFTKPVQVKTRLGYRDKARQIVTANWNAEFGKALARAIATAR